MEMTVQGQTPPWETLHLTVLGKNRAVANGPVGPAMAGPIIEPIINFLKFVIIFFGQNNNLAGIFFDIIFETETTQSPKCAL